MESFTFKRQFLDSVRTLPKETRADIVLSLVEYALEGKTSGGLGELGDAILSLLRVQVDMERTHKENGSKGGRPKGEQGRAAKAGLGCGALRVGG